MVPNDMAFPVNYRVLLCLIGFVVLLNFTQFFLNIKKGSDRKRPYPIYPSAVLGVTGDMYDERKENSSYIVTYDNIEVKLDNATVETRASQTTSKETAISTNKTTDYAEDEILLLCPQIPPDLGPLNSSAPLAGQFFPSTVMAGGYHSMKTCTSRQQLAVIVPYSTNYKLFAEFLNHIHAFLIMQQADYQIFVVRFENHSEPITRGQLFNIGVVEAQRQRNGWQCLVFHEPQVLPMDTRNLYRCNWYPRQLASTVFIEKEGLKYNPPIGGAVAITPEVFERLNGFSNVLFGRDEDFVDLHKRLRWANITLERTDPVIGLYKSYGTAPEANSTYSVVASPFHLVDGLTSLSYELKDLQFEDLFTLITVRDGITKKNDKLGLLSLLQ